MDNRIEEKDYKKLTFSHWRPAMVYAVNHRIWEKVEVIKRGDYYVFIDKKQID